MTFNEHGRKSFSNGLRPSFFSSISLLRPSASLLSPQSLSAFRRLACCRMTGRLRQRRESSWSRLCSADFVGSIPPNVYFVLLRRTRIHRAPPSNVAEGGHARRDQRTPAATHLHQPPSASVGPSRSSPVPDFADVFFLRPDFPPLAGGAEFLREMDVSDSQILMFL